MPFKLRPKRHIKLDKERPKSLMKLIWKSSMSWDIKCNEVRFSENPQRTSHINSFKYLKKRGNNIPSQLFQKIKEKTLPISFYLATITLIQS